MSEFDNGRIMKDADDEFQSALSLFERECQERHSRIRWRLKRKRTEMTNIHWTANSNVDFRYSVAADYVDQILEQLDRREMSQSDLAKRVGVSDGRVSQLVNSPGNLTLKTMVDWARAVDLKLAVVLYDDEDQNNLRGPILSDVFRDCWRMCDSPHNWFELYGDDDE